MEGSNSSTSLYDRDPVHLLCPPRVLSLARSLALSLDLPEPNPSETNALISTLKAFLRHEEAQPLEVKIDLVPVVFLCRCGLSLDHRRSASLAA